jgi:hypothetical protein
MKGKVFRYNNGLAGTWYLKTLTARRDENNIVILPSLSEYDKRPKAPLTSLTYFDLRELIRTMWKANEIKYGEWPPVWNIKAKP